MKNSFNKKLRQLAAENKQALSTRTAKVGGYSVVLALIVLAILVAVNVLFSVLPSKFTQFDISAAQLYSLTSDTKVVATNLGKDVTIYWITQAGQESTVLDKLLDRYQDLSDHITVVKKDPDIYPTFAQQYTDETVVNNSLVVECGDKSRYISYDDIYQVDTASYYTTGSVSQSFDGEGQITSAIDYVVSDELPKIYLLSGHGEAALSDTFSNELTRSNYETVEDFSLLNVDEIPKDCDTLLINDYNDIVATTADTLRPDEALKLDWDSVTSIDFTLDDTTYTITHKGSTYTLDGEEVDFDDIKSAVDGLDIAEYNTETSDKKQEIALTVHLDNTDYPTLTLCAYQYDGENCLVTLNDTTLGFAKRSLVVDLEEAVNAVVLGVES